jgi:hypothetical protein
MQPEWVPKHASSRLTGGIRISTRQCTSRAVLLALIAAALHAAAAPLSGDGSFQWTPAKVVLAIFLFFLAGMCEIGGGWLVWQVMTPWSCFLPFMHASCALAVHWPPGRCMSPNIELCTTHCCLGIPLSCQCS